MKNMINWFEIPVKDYNRAKKFYETLLDFQITDGDFAPWKMGFFPSFEGKISGSIVFGEGYEPSEKGALIYLNANPDLSVALAKVEAAGGAIKVPKKLISSEIGYWAIILDTEGNRIALHSKD